MCEIEMDWLDQYSQYLMCDILLFNDTLHYLSKVIKLRGWKIRKKVMVIVLISRFVEKEIMHFYFISNIEILLYDLES